MSIELPVASITIHRALCPIIRCLTVHLGPVVIESSDHRERQSGPEVQLGHPWAPRLGKKPKLK